MRTNGVFQFVACLLLLLAIDASAQFYIGPRGGCYTLGSGGRKRYVDRSYCAPLAPKTPGLVTQTSRVASGNTGYLRGPRGGCYTLSPSGSKRYVSREKCN